MKLKTIKESRNSFGRLLRLEAEISSTRNGKVFSISEYDNDGCQKSISLTEEDVKCVFDFFKFIFS